MTYEEKETIIARVANRVDPNFNMPEMGNILMVTHYLNVAAEKGLVEEGFAVTPKGADHVIELIKEGWMLSDPEILEVLVLYSELDKMDEKDIEAFLKLVKMVQTGELDEKLSEFEKEMKP